MIKISKTEQYSLVSNQIQDIVNDLKKDLNRLKNELNKKWAIKSILQSRIND